MVQKTESTGSRKVAPRYGIAEWYGADLLQMSDVERQERGHLAARQQQDGKIVDAPECPFLSNFIPGARCNKTGGVCTIRKYDSHGAPVDDDLPVTVCPNRFLDRFEDGSGVFEWISAKMLDVDDPIVVRETPFLRRISELSGKRELQEEMEAEAKQEEKKAGRIDWILVDPKTLSTPELAWCAVETQALYFSGGKMRAEFDAYAHAPSGVLFPTGKRRPDYRSSGPKRLWPQLDVKVPVLRDWHKKVVVLIDEFFFGSMNTLAESYPRAKDDTERRDNSHIVWFVVSFTPTMRLRQCRVVFTDLEKSRHALNATEPLSKGEFTKNLRSTLVDRRRGNKVFRT